LINNEQKNANTNLEKITKQTGHWTVKFTHISVVAKTAAATLKQISKIAADFVNTAREELKVQNLVAGAIKATGREAQISAREITTMANRLQRVTNFNSSEIMGKVSNVLLTFRNVQGEVFNQATEAALNMASALGTDLQSASLQLGKALEDPIEGVSSLSRVGVRLSETQKEQIKTFMEMNKVAEAQGVILAELSNTFGGQAQNIADPIIQMKNAFSDWKQELGMSLIPLTHTFANGLKNLFTIMTPVKTNIEQVTKETQKQIGEFQSLIYVYESLRFKHGQTIDDNEVLKNVIGKLNSQFSEYLGNIDLATVKYDDYRQSISRATEELIKEATTKRLLATQDDHFDKIAKEIIKYQDQINAVNSRIHRWTNSLQ
jgi:TolB-like protein